VTPAVRAFATGLRSLNYAAQGRNMSTCADNAPRPTDPVGRDQASDDLTLTLARQGIHLLIGDVPRELLLGRFQRQLRRLSLLRTSTSAQDSPADTGFRPESAGSEAVFSQAPPWFDPRAFEERIRHLHTPWQDEDRRTSGVCSLEHDRKTAQGR
jgi:hypothetical protein